MAALLAATVMPLSAQTSEILTLSRCRELALANNSTLAAAKWQVTQANEMVRSAKANYFPDFNASFTGAYSTAKGRLDIDGGNLPVLRPDGSGMAVPDGSFAYFPGVGLEYKVGPVVTGGIELTQPIYMGGKIAASVSAARESAALAEANRSKTSVDIVLEVSRAYADAVKAVQLLEIAQSYRSVVDELQSNVASAIRHGMRHNNDLLKVKVRLNEADLNILKARNAIRLSKMNLCRVIGYPMISDIEVVADFPEPDVIPVPASSDAIDSRPEWKMLEARNRMLEAQVKVARSEMLPQLGLQAGYRYNYGLEVNDRVFLNDGAFSVFINLKVPLYHFGGRSSKVKAQKARLQQSIDESDNSRKMMELEMRRAWADLEEATAAFEMTETALEQARENMRVSRTMFDNGLETLSDYLEAQLLWQQSGQQYVEAGFDKYVSYLDYLRASADPSLMD